jgi:hypothetical protein
MKTIKPIINFVSKFLSGSAITVLIAVALLTYCKRDVKPFTSFTTGGHTVYHLQPAQVSKRGKHSVVAAAFDGTVLCYSADGKPIWEKKINDFFPFDLAVADIDNDGLDEALVATAGGSVDAYDSDGTHLWSFKREAPFYQVCPARTGTGEWVIFTGGIQEEVFELSANGKLLDSINAGDVVRHIRKGDILGDGKEYVVVATTSSGLTGKLSLMLFDPAIQKPLWHKGIRGRSIYSMTLFDLNSDGKQDIVTGYRGTIMGFDSEGNEIKIPSGKKVPMIPYRMDRLSRINLKNGTDEKIFSIYANSLIIYDRDGKTENILNCKYDFTGGAFDHQTSTYYLGSSSSGGDGIYALHLDQQGWQKAFEEMRPVGRLAEIEKNIASLEEQVSNFIRPGYQRAPDTTDIFLMDNQKWLQDTLVFEDSRRPEWKDFRNLNFGSTIILGEKYGDRSELWCKKLGGETNYDMTSDEIINSVLKKDARGEDYLVYIGHGESLFMSPATMQRILEAPLKHFRGFLLTEMETVTPGMEQIVRTIILPLAEMCLKHEKIISIWNKNIFWNGTCYVDFWKEVLLNPKYSKVFILALEETNSRTQELSLAGRVGLWQTGYFERWGSRIVTDNGCFTRMWEWSSQQVLSHYLRQIVLNASLGTRFFQTDVFQGPFSEDLRNQLLVVYEMLEKGAVAIPEKSELLSLSDLCLGMKSPPSDEFIDHGKNGHLYNFNEAKKVPMVFDRLDCYWGGAPIPVHDFSSYGYGCERRMLNFLPGYPYGLVAIVPDETDLTKFQVLREKVTTDGQFFYDSSGQQHGAAEYKQTMLGKLQQAAARLPILVKGDVAWSVVSLDPNHVRVVLVDPGYTDPADREAEVILQHLNGSKCTDILSGEELKIENQKIHIKVPAGIFRIIDIAH